MQRVKFVFLLSFGFALTSCAKTVEGVALKNPQTNESVTCGPYKGSSDLWSSIGLVPDVFAQTPAVKLQSQCIDDFEKQGYVRLPRTN